MQSFSNNLIIFNLQIAMRFSRPFKGLENTESFHNGTESCETLPLRLTVIMDICLISPLKALSLAGPFHSGTESRDLLPLW